MLHPVTRPVRKPPAPPTTSLESALELFVLDRKVQRATENTILFYQRQLRPFIRWCSERGVESISVVAAAHVRAYLVSLQERDLSDRSVHAAARSLRAWFNFAVAEELLTVSPMVKVGMPKLDKRILPAFSADDVKRLLAACTTKRDRAALLFLLDTGCRATEFISLDGGDIDAKQGTVRIRQGKGRKDRVAFLGNKTRKALYHYYAERGGEPKTDEPVWVNERLGTRLTDSGLRQLLERIGNKAGVAECHPHTFRRTFALFSLRNGMSVYHLQQLMGHADLAMLRQYLALNDEDLQQAHRQFGVVDQFGKR